MATVSVAVCAEVLLIATDVGERLHVAGLVALEGVVVTAQARLTVPVNEFVGVTVMVAVLPLVAPGTKLMLPLLLSEKLVLPPSGACQKSPHPASSRAAAGSNRTQIGILMPPSFVARYLIIFKGIASARVLSHWMQECKPAEVSPALAPAPELHPSLSRTQRIHKPLVFFDGSQCSLSRKSGRRCACIPGRIGSTVFWSALEPHHTGSLNQHQAPPVGPPCASCSGPIASDSPLPFGSFTCDLPDDTNEPESLLAVSL